MSENRHSAAAEPHTDAETRNVKARTSWRRWVFRGYVALTVALALWIGAADPFAVSGAVDDRLLAWIIPPLLFLGLAAGLGWLALLVFSRRTPAADSQVERRRHGPPPTQDRPASRS